MSTCSSPMKMYPTPTGRYLFEKPSGHSGSHIFIPCGGCLACRLKYTQDWSIRMLHEQQMHEHSMFLTLTYNDEHLPENDELQHRDFQLFMKKLRSKYPLKNIRYVVSGEYGEQTGRAHYHAIIYGLDMEDKFQHAVNNLNQPRYISPELTQLWGLGHVDIGSVTKQSCAYVASYMLKDIKTGSWKDETEVFDPETGEVRKRKQPYACHSTKPAIGRTFCEKYLTDIFPEDTVFYTHKGKTTRTTAPNYYLKLLDKIDPDLANLVKANRSKHLWTAYAKAERKPHRLEAKDTCLKAKVSLGKRGSNHDK